MLSVGALLKHTREEKNISLKDAERHMKIRQKFITALECDEWSLFTSKIYIEGILKNYSRLLGLNDRKILAFFRREYEKKDDVRFKRRVKEEYLAPDSKKTMQLTIIIASVLLISYVLFQFYLYLKPPFLQVHMPNSKILRTIDRVKITGSTEKESVLTINGERVYLDKEGTFEYMLPTKKEKTNVSVEVVGANGKKTVYEGVVTKNR